MVASGLEYYGPSRTLVGIEQHANQLGYSLLLHLRHSSHQAENEEILSALTARRVDGIIWAIHEVGANRAWVRPERLSRLPPVVFLMMQAQPIASVIHSDNRAGARLATEHLLEQGCRRIGIISGPLQWWEARERVAGWRQTMADAGETALESLVVNGAWSARSGEAGLVKLLAQNPNLDGVFACNDQMALGALHAAHRLGHKVPDELAIVGYDNTEGSEFYWPPLSTVQQRLREIGRLAITELHRLIEARGSGNSVERPLMQTVTPQLIVRASSRRKQAHA